MFPYFLITEEEFCDNTVRIKLRLLLRHMSYSCRKMWE